LSHVPLDTTMRTAYPPSADAADESPLAHAATLYASSPHARIDERHRVRREWYGPRSKLFFGRSRRVDPTTIMLMIVVFGLLWIFVPWQSVWSHGHRSHALHAPERPTTIVQVMPGQKTFTLSSRGKGCHLVQAEVEHELHDLLRGVKVRARAALTQAGILNLFIQHTSAALSLNENFDRDVRTDMDMVRPRTPLC